MSPFSNDFVAMTKVDDNIFDAKIWKEVNKGKLTFLAVKFIIKGGVPPPWMVRAEGGPTPQLDSHLSLAPP